MLLRMEVQNLTAREKKKVAKNVASTGARTAWDIVLLILKILGTILLIILTTGIIFACIFAVYVKTTITPMAYLDLGDMSYDLTSVVYYYDDDTQQYEELTSLYGTVNREWVDYEDIPQHLIHATVAIEDQRFYKHHGVDWIRTIQALLSSLTGQEIFGGSTITQQTIKNATGNNEVTVQRKLLEIFQALELERNYTKEEIITYYLNLIYFGEGCYGIYSASYTYFGKPVQELSVAECASLIGITNNPSLYDPYISSANKERNLARQQIILDEMYDQGYFDSEEEYLAAKNEELVFVRGEDDEYEYEVYSWYVDALIEEVIEDLMDEQGLSYTVAERLIYTGGYQIYACIDPDIQADVDYIYQNPENFPDAGSSTQQLQSSIIIIDPYTGDIVAMAGGVGEKTANRVQNLATQSLRPPGSSFKPIATYTPAMDQGLINPDSLVYDGPNIKLNGTDWYPHNYSAGSYSGLVTIRQAVASSLNTVAAQVMDVLTPWVSYDYLANRLGITSLVVSDDEGHTDIDYAPLALGQLTYGITNEELTNAYCALVNKGIFIDASTYTQVLDSDGNVVLSGERDTNVAFSEAAATNMTSMLVSTATWGGSSSANLGTMPTAGKTGTTTDNKDRWFVGYTPYYVAGVWVGYETPETLSLSYNPAPAIWRSVMSLVHEDLEWRDFDPVIPLTTGQDLLSEDPWATDMEGWKIDLDDPNIYYNPETGWTYHVDTGKYYDSDGNEIDGETGELIPQDAPGMEGWSIDVNDPTIYFNSSNGWTYNTITGQYFNSSGEEIDPDTGQPISPDLDSDPSPSTSIDPSPSPSPSADPSPTT